jgi:signal peptide peptidase SppA, 67K type
MKNFFKTLFASTLGVIIGLTIVSIFSVMIFAGILASKTSSSYNLEDKTVLKLDLGITINERATSNPLSSIIGGQSEAGLDDILDAIKKAKENDEIKGIYINAGSLTSGIATLDPIRSALIDFKESGKFVVAYGDDYNQATYYVASVADKIILNPKGSVGFHGLSMIPVFVRGFYENLGIKYQIFKVGTFKSAVEPVIQDKMSDANRLQTTSYLNDIWSHLLKNISESRNIPIDTLNRYADEYLDFVEAETILKYNLVDTLMYATDVDTYLKGLTDTEQKEKLKLATIENMTSVESKEKNESKEKVAVLYAEGSIVGDDHQNSPFSSEATITAKQYVKELQKLKDDEDVKAVVFRVNSGGGSAYASEQIWKAVVELKEKKPIIVSMGDLAASGGYYISCAATSIIAEPTTLTGSIGIFGAIPQGEELAKKIGLTFDEVKTNKHGRFGGTVISIPFLASAYSRGLTDEEGKMIQNYVERGYELFIGRCADGRSMTKAQIDSIGQGRVWTGNQALEIGLVDKLGNIDDAIRLAAEKAALESYQIVKYPEKKDFFTQILDGSKENAKIRALKVFLGNDEFDKNVFKQQMESFDIRQAVISEQIIF